MLKLSTPVSVIALGILCAVASLAQFESGSVLGTITDPSGKPVSGAVVTLTNIRTGTSAQGKTDASGDFLFVNQRLGSYQVRAEMTGFRVAQSNPFELSVDARQRIDLRL